MWEQVGIGIPVFFPAHRATTAVIAVTWVLAVV